MSRLRLPAFILCVGVIVLLTLFFMIIYFQIKVTTSKKGASFITSQATFFIPAKDPTKIVAFSTKPEQLLNEINNIIKTSPATFGIYVKNLTTNQEITINADDSFKSASLYKLGLMFIIFQKAETGKLNIYDPVIQSNLNAMITYSSNDAAYYLINTYSSWTELNQVMHSIGLTHSDFQNDPPMTTPADIGHLLELLAQGQLLNQQDSLKMLELMNEQQINDRIPMLLPTNAVIAHKTGELDDVRHDVAIIGDENNDFVLVLMSKNSIDPEAVKPLMSQIAKLVYDYFHNQWKNTPEIL